MLFRSARKLVRMGADAIVIEGMEAGGHIGPVSTGVLAQEILPSGTVAGVRQEIDRLTQAGGSTFWDKYAPLLQSDTDVVAAHGRLRRAMNALPEKAETVHHRKEWSAPRVHAKRSRRS